MCHAPRAASTRVLCGTLCLPLIHCWGDRRVNWPACFVKQSSKSLENTRSSQNWNCTSGQSRRSQTRRRTRVVAGYKTDYSLSQPRCFKRHKTILKRNAPDDQGKQTMCPPWHSYWWFVSRALLHCTFPTFYNVYVSFRDKPFYLFCSQHLEQCRPHSRCSIIIC